ncbi:OLC1v1028725C2 [Oldenlandia corymbosa var. corymbosa]|uniref:DNA 3'-5' helicase n=1 Tax=Oldenlandia corymbosa var. corymbosa TaxID=529605 RepID=A0AAV1CD44_OLDCO|nr:OLC1v1028725C2 [Oldenlandia corymbosa var. corymbosa]
MGSDFDSRAYQISATPHRDSKFSSISSAKKSITNTKAASASAAAAAAAVISTSRLVLKVKPPSNKKKKKKNHSSNTAENAESEGQLEENPSQLPLPTSSPEIPNFTVIRRSDSGSSNPLFPSSKSAPLSACGRILSRFTKSQRENITFQPIESDPVGPKLQGIEKEGANNSSTKKHPNSIGGCGNVSSSPSSGNLSKRVKSVSDGNFVKLNINGYGSKKFKFKGKRKSFASYSSTGRPRFSKKWKGKAGVGVEGGELESGFCEEEGLVWERKQNEEKKRSTFDAGMIEEAVMMVRNEASDDNLLRLLKLTHGYNSFRDGQLEAVKTVLSGKSTMLVLPTGAGKSLCYQLPAVVLPGITLVVSPLVALMIDQLKHLPPAIPGGLLCSSQTQDEACETLELLKDQAIKVLFVSPERLLNAEFLSIFSGISSPLVSLVVIDEAHCVSEWSHNFRPSYMRLRASVLYAKLHAQCILAMTATATSKTLHDVMHALEIPAGNLIQAAKMRDNLQLSLSMTGGNRMKDLMTLLKSLPFLEVKSIIIYCKFQYETDNLSKFLCDNNISAKSYHSSIPAKERRTIQEQFCKNKIRVVVATVAFGMGLDKKDIGAVWTFSWFFCLKASIPVTSTSIHLSQVIHYSLPESLEGYVQEIGRAGRDGRLSYCHLFFDEATYFKMRSLMHSDGVDDFAVIKFLSQVFHNGISSSGKICSLIKESASRKFDIKEEVMLTILTHLEIGDIQYLNLLPQLNVTCTVNFHQVCSFNIVSQVHLFAIASATHLKEVLVMQTSPGLLALNDTLIAAILRKSELKDGQYVFDIPSVANSIRLLPAELSSHLHNLKLKGEITYEMKDQAYCYTILGVPNDICSMAANTAKWLSQVERCKVQKLDAMFNAAAFAIKECDKVAGCDGHQHTTCLAKKISEYFNKDDEYDVPNKMGEHSRFLSADIKVFLQSHSQAKFTPRAVARIMHGIGSPAFPSATWSKTHFWGRYMETDFKVVMEAAQAELLNFVSKHSA